MKRVYLIVPEEEIDDYTRTSGEWIIKGEKYNYVTKYPTDGDGECYAVVVQRTNDKKFFEFTWCYDDGAYYYDSEWSEVLPKVTRNIEWGWPDEE